jgi:hypothetical protein
MYEYCTSCNDAWRTPTTCNSCCYEIMIAYKDWNPTAYILLCDNPPLLILDVTKTELEFKAKELWLKDFKITWLYK